MENQNGNMDECIMYEVRNYQNASMMTFVMNVVLYAFLFVRKEDGLYDLCFGRLMGAISLLSLLACMCA